VNAPDGLIIRSETDLSELILAQLGHNSEDMSPLIKKFVEDNKISVMNAPN
jgi:hypothetical protein